MSNSFISGEFLRNMSPSGDDPCAEFDCSHHSGPISGYSRVDRILVVPQCHVISDDYPRPSASGSPVRENDVCAGKTFLKH